MAINLTVNGVSYSYPEEGDENWGLNGTNWAQAVTQGMLQKSGGLFTLTADVDFGANFGLKSIYYSSRASNPSSTGVVRLGSTEIMSWRNTANNADLELGVNTADDLTFNGNPIIPATGLTASRAVVTDSTGQLTTATTTSTEIGYVNGVTSAIQTQLDARVVGPSSADDNAIVRFDSTTGKLVKNSGITITNAGVLVCVDGTAGAPGITFSGDTDTGIFHTTNIFGIAATGLSVSKHFVTGGTSPTISLSNVSADDAILRLESDQGSLRLIGDVDTAAGGQVRLFGPSHSTRGNDIEFLANGSAVADWDQSDGEWTFFGKVAISGDTNIGGTSTLATLIATDISGDTLYLSGDATIAGALIATDISGDTLYLSGNAEVVGTSTLATLIATDISGDTLYLSGDATIVGDVTVQRSEASASVFVLVENTSTASSSQAYFHAKTAAISGNDDAYFRSESSSTNWVAGVDGSTDNYVIANNTGMTGAANHALTITTGKAVTVANGNFIVAVGSTTILTLVATDISGDSLYISGNAEVVGTSTLATLIATDISGDTLYLSGDATIAGALIATDISGDSLYISGNAEVVGTSTLATLIATDISGDTLYLSGDATIVGDVTVQRSEASASVFVLVENTSTASSSQAYFHAKTASTSGNNDAYFRSENDATNWVAGVNGDNDNYVIANNTGMAGATNHALTINTSKSVTIPNGNLIAAGGYFQVSNQADPGVVTNGIRIGSIDSTGSDATLSLRTEKAVVTESITIDSTLIIQHNGAFYKVGLEAL